jgi:general secretion pathway protein G
MGPIAVSVVAARRDRDAPTTQPAESRAGSPVPRPLCGRMRRAMLKNVLLCDSRRCRDEAGFTLLEILVVIVILGLLIGLVAPAALRQLGGAKISIAHQSIARLSSVLDLYRLDVGNYPSAQQGLQALVTPPSGVANWSGPYLKGTGVPVDPWNHPFVYRIPSTRQGYDYDLCSIGADAQENDTTRDHWICN